MTSPAISSESESVDSNRSSKTHSSSLINTKAKVRDSKLALTLQSVKESMCTVLQKESDAKQETRTKLLTEFQKYNLHSYEYMNVMSELQKERNTNLKKQLKVLERMENKIYSRQEEISDEELQD